MRSASWSLREHADVLGRGMDIAQRPSGAGYGDRSPILPQPVHELDGIGRRRVAFTVAGSSSTRPATETDFPLSVACRARWIAAWQPRAGRATSATSSACQAFASG